MTVLSQPPPPPSAKTWVVKITGSEADVYEFVDNIGYWFQEREPEPIRTIAHDDGTITTTLRLIWKSAEMMMLLNTMRTDQVDIWQTREDEQCESQK